MQLPLDLVMSRRKRPIGSVKERKRERERERERERKRDVENERSN